MKYLFFDIECSNCFNGVGKMCEFGYVLTDEKFNVISSDDIPMSPGKDRESRFYLKGRKHEKDLELVEDPSIICFAYSMDNDIPHLYHACKRYKKGPFNYECYDVQKLVAAYLEKKGQMSLHNACKEIVGPHSIIKLHEHLSRDDAMMEKLIFEAICELTQTDSITLLEQSQFARTNSIEYMDKIINREKRKRIKTAGHELYNSLAVKEAELDKEENIGRRYNVSAELKKDLETLKTTINIIQSRNGILCNKISKSDYFILYDDKNRE